MKISSILLALTAATTIAADWPQWRGANRDDNSTETGLLKTWPAEGPKRIWLFENAGMGYAGFSISAGKLFTLGTRDGKEILLALDANTGKELWATPIGEIYGNGWGDGPRSTPTVDADRVYAMSGKGNLICAATATGKLTWAATMQDLGGKTPGWGYTESPLVDGQNVLCTPGGDKGTMAALDKLTGKLVWQTPDLVEGAQYSSIITATIGGKKQHIQLVMQTLFGVDPANGKLLWTSPWPGRTAVIPTPIVKDDEIFISSGYGVGCKKVKITNNVATDIFMNKDMENHHGGVILVGQNLFGHSGKAGWTCMNFADGTVNWTHKGVGKGAIAYADGMLYTLSEKTGDIALIEATPTAFTEKGKFTLTPQAAARNPKGAIWVHPVIANGKLYLRDQEFIYCHDIKAQ